MNLVTALVERQAEHATWRQDIHAHPELAFQEHRTADFVAEKLAAFGIEVVRGLGRTGVVGTLKAGHSDRAIGARAPWMPLPLQELNAFRTLPATPASCTPAATTVTPPCCCRGRIPGTAPRLRWHRAFHLPTGGGRRSGGQGHDGRRLVPRLPMEAVYALHNWPGLPVARWLCARGRPWRPSTSSRRPSPARVGMRPAHLVIDPIQVGVQLCRPGRRSSRATSSRSRPRYCRSPSSMPAMPGR